MISIQKEVIGMKTARRLQFCALAAVLPLFGVLAGCGGGLSRYSPTSDEARSSLEAALTAWRDGKPFGEVEAKPPVRPVDSAWQGGQQLASFEIGEQEDGEFGTKQFVVKLAMKNSKGSQDVRYIVHGRDPVWVYREEDYKRTQNMENNPVTTPKTKRVVTRPGRNR
jgi:hypothetical protein